MPATTRAIDRAHRLTDRQLRDVGEEFREWRLVLGVSQEHVARACRMSRNHYGQVENGRARAASIAEINRISAALGLVTSLRLYPSGPSIRDAGHAKRLKAFLAEVRPPLTFRLEVALPRSETHSELRAWDGMLFGGGARTAFELEMRLRDVQALRRRIDLKRRDDPTESFLLLVADTRTNRLVLADFAQLFADLPRLRPSAIRSLLAAGRHPPTGLVLLQSDGERLEAPDLSARSPPEVGPIKAACQATVTKRREASGVPDVSRMRVAAGVRRVARSD